MRSLVTHFSGADMTEHCITLDGLRFTVRTTFHSSTGRQRVVIEVVWHYPGVDLTADKTDLEDNCFRYNGQGHAENLSPPVHDTLLSLVRALAVAEAKGVRLGVSASS